MRSPEPRHWPDLLSRSRRRMVADVESEIGDWLDARAAEWRARGLSTDEAFARARAEFGDIDATRSYCVEQDRAFQRRSTTMRFLEDTRQDLRIAVRNLVRSPGLSLTLLFTMALGIGATVAMYSVVRSVLLRPLGYRDEASLVQLHTLEAGKRAPAGQLSARAFLAMREQSRVLSGVAAVAGGNGALTGDGAPETIDVGRVSVNLLPLLGREPVLGSWFPPAADSAGAEEMIVLGDALWRRRYGADPAIVGRSVELNARRRRVVGVLPADFRLPLYADAEAVVPLDLTQTLADPARSHKFRFMRLIARIKPNVAAVAVQGDLDRVMALLAAERPDAYQGMGVEPVTLREEITGDVKPALLSLLGASVLLLLIACANIASVLMARAISRQSELGVRVALGAGRGRMVRQLMVESLVVAITGGVLGVGVAMLGVSALRVIGANAIPAGIPLAVDAPSLLAALALSVLCGLFFGSAPALVAGAIAVRSIASGAARGTDAPARRRLRRSLVIGQVALSVALLCGAGLLSRSLGKLMHLNLGYQTAQMIGFQLSLPGQRYDSGEKENAFFASLAERVQAVPGVLGSAVITALPLTGGSGASLVIQGRPFAGERPPEVRYSAASDDYFRLIGIPLIRGRAFAPGDESPEVQAVVVSASAARRYWGSDDPIGSRIQLGPDPTEPMHTVVGVVGDVVQETSRDPAPTVYSSTRYDHWGGGQVVVKYVGDPAPIRAGAALRRGRC